MKYIKFFGKSSVMQPIMVDNRTYKKSVKRFNKKYGYPSNGVNDSSTLRIRYSNNYHKMHIQSALHSRFFVKELYKHGGLSI